MNKLQRSQASGRRRLARFRGAQKASAASFKSTRRVGQVVAKKYGLQAVTGATPLLIGSLAADIIDTMWDTPWYISLVTGFVAGAGDAAFGEGASSLIP